MQKTELLTWSRYDVLCWMRKATRQELIKLLQEFDFNASDEFVLTDEGDLWTKQELALKLGDLYTEGICADYTPKLSAEVCQEFTDLIKAVIELEELYSIREVQQMFDLDRPIAIKLLIDCYQFTDKVTFNTLWERVPRNGELNLTENKTLITTKTGFLILVTEAEISLYKSDRPAEPIFSFQIDNHE